MIDPKFFKDVEKGKYEHYYFLPERFYNESQEAKGGMIVDLQEIDYLYIQDCQEIESPGIDYCLLHEYDEDKQMRWKRMFWLKGEDDYVDIEGKIKSPRREHLIQRFSNVFARIGIDTLSDEEYARIIGVS